MKFYNNNSNFIFTTKQFEEDLDKHGMNERVKKLLNGISINQITSVGKYFEKYKLNNYRLICKDISDKFDENLRFSKKVILFLKVLNRDDNDYQYLHASNIPTSKTKKSIRNLNSLFTEQTILRIKNSLKDLRQKSNKKVSLPEEYIDWLQTPPEWRSSEGILDIAIYESNLWIENKLDEEYTPLQEILDFIITEEKDKLTINELEKNIYFAKKPEKRKKHSIIFSEYEFNNKRIIYLIAKLKLESNKDIVKYYNKIKNKSEYKDIILKITEDNVDIEEILKKSSKAYPGEIVFDPDKWINIQKEEEANLALSGEEERLLNKLLSHESEYNLPVFINGRAGSGKSTMLLYLFAMYMHKTITNKYKGDILYLTYNENLLENTKNIQQKILSNHYALSEYEKQFENNIEHLDFDKFLYENIENSFKTFYEILLEVLPENKKEKYLKEELKINFKDFEVDIFNKKILSNNIRSKISAETAWHVIRTYIKGRDYNDFLTPKNYKNIPKKDKTVDASIYKLVYENVWNIYFEYLEENNRWDDQDLVREALNHINKDDVVIDKDYISIFCDEAQDFSKIELKFILQLSALNKYNLNEIENFAKILPFAFAGDPLQTITPTGFSWSRFKAMLYNEIIDNYNIDNAEKFTRKSQFNLTYNYRSAPEIVKYSNNIQLLRKIICNEEVEPQEAWFEREESMPKIFILNQDITEEEFIEYSEDTIIITPYTFNDFDSLKNEIELDSILNKLVLEQRGNINENKIMEIFTPLTSKGLEFDKVIIYKFGDFLEDNLSNMITEHENEDQLKLEYFINRLYVAITRAKKQLIIVDTIEGKKNLWDHFDTNKLEVYNNEEYLKWKNKLGKLLRGESPEELEETNPLKIAENIKKQGILSEDPMLLERAKNSYKRHGKENEAILCDAYYNLYEHNYKKAGRLFEEIDRKEKALDCYWEGYNWYKIIQWYDKNEWYAETDYLKVAKYLNLNIEDKFNEKIEYGLTILFEEDLLNSKISDSKQQKEVKKSFIEIIENNIDKIKPEIISEIAIKLEENPIEFEEFSNDFHTLLIKLYFKSNNHNKVIEIVEENQLKRTDLYVKSKCKTSNYPDIIDYLFRLEKYEKITSLYEKNNFDLKSEDKLSKVASSYEELNNHIQAAQIYLSLKETKKVESILKKNKNDFIKYYEDNEEVFFLDFFKLMMNDGRIGDIYFDIIGRVINNNNLQIKLYKLLFSLIASDNNFSKSQLSDMNSSSIRSLFNHTKKFVLNYSNYKFDIIEASVAYEKLGVQYKMMLGYYEELMEMNDINKKINNFKQLEFIYNKKTNLLEFARKRWLYSKIHFIEVSDKMSEKDEMEHRKEITKKLKDWNMNKNDIPNSIPDTNLNIDNVIEKSDNNSDKINEANIIEEVVVNNNIIDGNIIDGFINKNIKSDSEINYAITITINNEKFNKLDSISIKSSNNKVKLLIDN